MFKFKMAEFELLKGLQSVKERINSACAKKGRKDVPRLVAVSKTKPIQDIIKVYDTGHRNFGENYIQELVDKSGDAEILEKCKEIRWHYIGHLQRNKVNKLLSVPGLYLIETVDNDKLATALDSAWCKQSKSNPLNIMVQVNTSREEEKHGCTPEETKSLVQHILEKCPNLKLVGLMTIGQYGYDWSKGPNPDFLCLCSCRETVCKDLNLNIDDVELSMGMSDDFEHAIELGSTNVRVGSSIFGFRAKKPSKKVNEVTDSIDKVKISD